LAIEHGPTGLFVYQVQPDNTVQAVTVQAGYADDGRTVITKGLKGGETVVIGGQSRLSPGTHVRINTAPQTADDSTQQPG
jgi:multidrug efflux system membrane fusion protein